MPSTACAWELLLFTSYKSYYSPPLCSTILSVEDAQEGGRQPALSSHRGEGKGLPQEHFVPGFNGFLKPSIMYRSPAPPPPLDQKRVGFIITGHKSLGNFTKVQKQPFPNELHQRQRRNSKMTQIKGPTCQGLKDTKKCLYHSLAGGSVR